MGGKDLLIPVGNLVPLCDLGIAEEQEMERQKQEEEEENKDEYLPLYQPSIARKKDLIAPHSYNLRPRKQKLVNSQVVLTSMYL